MNIHIVTKNRFPERNLFHLTEIELIEKLPDWRSATVFCCGDDSHLSGSLFLNRVNTADFHWLSCARNYVAALRYGTGPSLILEDDLLLTADFKNKLLACVERVPVRDYALTLYSCKLHKDYPLEQMNPASFDGCKAIYLTEKVRISMAEFIQHQLDFGGWSNVDSMVSRFLEQTGVMLFAANPNLVQHITDRDSNDKSRTFVLGTTKTNRRTVEQMTVCGFPLAVEDFGDSILRTAVKAELENDCYGFKNINPNPELIFDVGANVGITSMVLSRLFPTARIIAYEPHPENYTSLCGNLKRNSCLNVIPIEKAIDGSASKLEMTMHESNTGGATGWVQAVIDGKIPTVEVDCITLDDALNGHGGKCDFLKIDTEGAEHSILAGFTGWDRVGCIGAELHQNNLLERMGYTIERTEALIREKMGSRPVKFQYCNPMFQ